MSDKPRLIYGSAHHLIPREEIERYGADVGQMIHVKMLTEIHPDCHSCDARHVERSKMPHDAAVKLSMGCVNRGGVCKYERMKVNWSDISNSVANAFSPEVFQREYLTEFTDAQEPVNRVPVVDLTEQMEGFGVFS